MLVGIAPIIGTARSVTAASAVARAFGFAILVLEDEIEAEIEADPPSDV